MKARRATLIATLLSGVLLVPVAYAKPASQRTSSDFWSAVASPQRHRARELVAQAKTHVRIAMQQLPGSWESLCRRTHAIPFPVDTVAVREGRTRALRQWLRQALQRRAHLDSALARLDLARELAPNDPDVVYTRADVLALWEQPGSLWHCRTYRRDDAAIRAFEHLRRLAPTYQAGEVAFELGVLYTRKHAFGRAAREYELAIERSFDERETSVMRSNLAEVTMLAGDVRRAVEHYERALELTQGGRDYLLAQWGLAVALDRLGEHEAAIEHAQSALRAGGGTMHVLHAEGVFFEPPWEIYYYEALGYEARARREPSDREAHLQEAATRWQRYLDATDQDAPWRAAAKANLHALQEALNGPEPTS